MSSALPADCPDPSDTVVRGRPQTPAASPPSQRATGHAPPRASAMADGAVGGGMFPAPAVVVVVTA